MFQRLISFTQTGLTVQKVLVEADLFSGLPCLNILGLTETAAKDVRERIRSALASIGYTLPAKKITVNLAPDGAEASAPKRLPADGLDLPIALCILCADGRLPSAKNDTVAVVGNLSLSGRLRPVSGIRRIVSALRSQNSGAAPTLLLPRENVDEASLIPDVRLLAADDLNQAAGFWRDLVDLPPMPHRRPVYRYPSEQPLLTVRGQERGKRALIVACAGYHNLLLSGPPGCGKTLLAQAAPALLPPPDLSTQERILMVTEQVLVEDLPEPAFTRPVRQPHHSLTVHALIGGGHPIAPGELSLADGGLLILDEIAEFSGHVLENLRQPLESHRIVLSYLGETQVLPADFMMIGTMNLCPCGQFPSERCICRPSAIHRYQNRLGGPLLDRMDLCLLLNPVSEEERSVYTEAEVQRWKDRILEASERQSSRFREEPFSFNSRIPPDKIGTYIRLSAETETLFQSASRRFGLSLRQQHNTLKTARSIADLAGCENILKNHLAEAFGYRPRGYFVT